MVSRLVGLSFSCFDEMVQSQPNVADPFTGRLSPELHARSHGVISSLERPHAWVQSNDGSFGGLVFAHQPIRSPVASDGDIPAGWSLVNQPGVARQLFSCPLVWFPALEVGMRAKHKGIEFPFTQSVLPKVE